MEQRSLFQNLSPLDHRYYLSNRDLFDRLGSYLSEDAAVKYAVRCEAALLKAHLELRFPEQQRPELQASIDALEFLVTSQAVYEEEEKTQHNIRALVNVIKRHLPPALVPFVHLGATSVDMLDTANALKIRDAVRLVLVPLLAELETALAKLARQESLTPQIGRTHGQHAVPITVGFALAEYVSRLGKSILEIQRLSGELRGKFAGAVGAYNATSVMTTDPQALERLVLGYLGLEPSEHSTQLVEPEYLLRLLLEINVAFGVIANLADDLRNLQRSEIGEFRELFTATQVGSSTMPQKRNPWNSEHVKSLWKAFAPRAMTFFLDQISEHQRDLTNSASGRFVTDYLAGFVAAVARMKKVVTTLSVDKASLERNLRVGAGDLVLAESVYILLSLAGEPEGHEVVRVLTLECEAQKKTLLDALKARPAVWATIQTQLKATTGWDAEHFFSHPDLYHGQAPQKAVALADKYESLMKPFLEVRA
ncbi:MAG: lyase family protein [Spirochaetales bacterium]